MGALGAGGAAAYLTGAGHFARAEEPERRPNIIYVFSAEHRWWSLSFNEMPELHTPTFERLAGISVHSHCGGQDLSHLPLDEPGPEPDIKLIASNNRSRNYFENQIDPDGNNPPYAFCGARTERVPAIPEKDQEHRNAGTASRSCRRAQKNNSNWTG